MVRPPTSKGAFRYDDFEYYRYGCSARRIVLSPREFISQQPDSARWTAALGVAGLWSIWLLVPLAIILVPFNLTPMRKSMISAPVFRGFRKVMPPMSRTEKEAIDAGTTRWEGDLFQASLTGKTAQLSTTATHCRRASVSRRPGRRSVPDGERFPDYP